MGELGFVVVSIPSVHFPFWTKKLQFLSLSLFTFRFSSSTPHFVCSCCVRLHNAFNRKIDCFCPVLFEANGMTLTPKQMTILPVSFKHHSTLTRLTIPQIDICEWTWIAYVCLHYILCPGNPKATKHGNMVPFAFGNKPQPYWCW